MVLEVLVHPKRVERRSVKAREEHIDDDEQIDLALLHALRKILVIILEGIPVR